MPPGTNVIDADTGAFASNSTCLPYAYINEKVSPNEVGFRAFAKKLASYMETEFSTSNDVYETSGDSADYFYDCIGIAAITAEMGQKFHEPCNYFEETLMGNLMGILLYAARISRTPYSLPKGPEVMRILTRNENESVEVEVFVSDHRRSRQNAITSQNILSVKLDVDDHPYYVGATPIQEITSELFSPTESIEFIVSSEGFTPRQHNVYIQPHDTEGPEPVHSAFVQITEAISRRLLRFTVYFAVPLIGLHFAS